MSLGLFHQDHALGLRRGSIAKTVSVDSRSHRAAIFVQTVPDQAVSSLLEISVRQGFHFLTPEIVDYKAQFFAGGIHIEADSCARVEGVGMILKQLE